jgi:transcriptional regulator with GAF, ATPase, and Fis domain
MQKRIIISLSIYSLVFFLGGAFIISTIDASTGKLNNLIKLYQIEAQRKQLLLRIKNVQTDLHLKRTSHAKNVQIIIENVDSMETMARSCFDCHHSEGVTKRLLYLQGGILDYKKSISRVLTLRANSERLKAADNVAFHDAEKLLWELNKMVHQATLRLFEKTQYSLRDIAISNNVLFTIVILVPFFVAGIGLVFLKGFTGPVKTILKATRNIKDGNLDYRIKGLHHEFGEVAESFNEMTERVENYTIQLEEKTKELARSNDEINTFCKVLRQIGVHQTLDRVGAFLIKELQGILNVQYLKLYILSPNRNALFGLTDKGVDILEEQELIQTASTIIDELGSTAADSQTHFPPTLLPDFFPADLQQTVLPFQIDNFSEGAFVIASTKNFLLKENKLNLVSLILEQASGSIKRAIVYQGEIRSFESRFDGKQQFSGIIGKDAKMQVIYKLIEDVAHTDSSILIQGETGTGKEMVANAIFDLSLRKDKPFVVINCSAYPATLLEGELFGHEKGAFTGAVSRKKGRFEQAHGGTVFLDEVGEMPLSAQVKLLRVLQSQKFKRLGGLNIIEVDVRIITATNRDLLQEVKNGNFREDLFYRLNVIPLHLPPLRQRGNDTLLLARYFQRKFASERGEAVPDFSSETLSLLMEYHWPGNVRELENTIEHAVVISKGKRIEVMHLPSTITSHDTKAKDAQYAVLHETTTDKARRSIIGNEKNLLQEVLEEYNWNKSKAAERLGIARSTLYAKIKKHQLSEPDNK